MTIFPTIFVNQLFSKKQMALKINQFYAYLEAKNKNKKEKIRKLKKIRTKLLTLFQLKLPSFLGIGCISIEIRTFYKIRKFFITIRRTGGKWKIISANCTTAITTFLAVGQHLLVYNFVRCFLATDKLQYI